MIKTKAVSDDLYNEAKAGLKKVGRDGEKGRRLQAIISVKEHGVTTVAKIFGVTRATIMSWIKRFKEESDDGLILKKGRGPKTKLPRDLESEIYKMIENNPGITIDQLRLIIEDNYKINIGRSTVHRLMKRLKFSYITPRPVHHKQDKATHEQFKKKSDPRN